MNDELTTIHDNSHRNALSHDSSFTNDFEDRKLSSYFTVREISRAWARAYQSKILPSLKDPEQRQAAIDEVDGLIDLFDIAINTLVNVSDKQVMRALNALQNHLGNEWVNEKAGKEKMRRLVRKVKRQFELLAIHAAHPHPIQRGWARLTGRETIALPEDTRERFGYLVGTGLAEMSRTIGSHLGMPEEIREAYVTLGLGTWATKAEIERRAVHLARSLHPDAGGSSDQMQRVFAARDLLVSWRSNPA